MQPVHSLLSLSAWYLLPDFITRQLLGFPLTNRLLSLLLTRSPSPRKLYARTFSVVVLSYLLYTLINSIVNTPPNFYQILGVTPDVDEAGLKVAFRQFARVFHPDRRGGQGEEMFVAMREIYEALRDPVKKYAYDRFGPGILACQTCASKREYLRQGLPGTLIYHLSTGIVITVVGLLGRRDRLVFWRWILYLTLFLAEVSLIIAPSTPLYSSTQPASPLAIEALASTFPSLLSFMTSLLPSFDWKSTQATSVLSPPPPALSTLLKILMPARVPYQHIAFLHQFFIFLNLALARVVPTLLGPQLDDEKTRKEEERTIYQMSKSLDEQAKEVLRQTMSLIKPLQTDGPSDQEELLEEMETMIVEGTIKNGLGPQRWNQVVQQFFAANQNRTTVEGDPKEERAM